MLSGYGQVKSYPAAEGFWLKKYLTYLYMYMNIYIYVYIYIYRWGSVTIVFLAKLACIYIPTCICIHMYDIHV